MTYYKLKIQNLDILMTIKNRTIQIKIRMINYYKPKNKTKKKRNFKNLTIYFYNQKNCQNK